MRRVTKLVILGKPGSFHDAASRAYFGGSRLDTVSASSFGQMAEMLSNDTSIHYGVMAIENALAGSLLKNYDILREYGFWISGEIYTRVRHQLMALPNQTMDEITEIHSHPMALHQCSQLLRQYPHIQLVEASDTASAAYSISTEELRGKAAIASELASEIYGLNIIAPDIEDSKINYTRFVIISREEEYSSLGNANKASIYLRTPHAHGSLLKVLQSIADHSINISKLQSFPVKGLLNSYYFHIDVEFEKLSQYEDCIDVIKGVSTHLDELGIYRRAVVPQEQQNMTLVTE